MMNCELSFRNLPFVPEAKQVIFLPHHTSQNTTALSAAVMIG